MVRLTVIVGALAATMLLVGSATGDPGADKARVDARIADLKAKADHATGDAKLLTTELSNLTSRVRAEQGVFAAAQSRLGALEASLASERARLAVLGDEIVTQTARLVILERQYETALAVLERRLRDIYISDEPDLISFALGTTSFGDLLDNVELLNRIGAQDDRVATRLDSSRKDLDRTRAATLEARKRAARTESLIAARTADQRVVRDRLAASRNALVAAQGAKARALSTVREDRAEFIAEADGLAAQSAALAAAIAAAQQARDAAPDELAPLPSTSPGQLGWPAAGPVTSGFGPRWGRMHEGIDISVGMGTPVHAAAEGVVSFSGWIGGYGNVVIINHGGGLSTVYAHNSSLVVSQGAAVGRGFVVALAGSTGRSSGPHVHFEVRVNGAAVDPLRYL